MERPIAPFGDIDAAMKGRGESVVPRPTGRGPNARKPWLALLLGIFVPAAGFAYVGRLGT